MFIENTVDWSDPRRMSIVRMCHRGTPLGHAANEPCSKYFCVDGKVWLIVLGKRCVLLGQYADWCHEVRIGARLVAGREVLCAQ